MTKPAPDETTEYDNVTEREWVEYEFGTIQYDYQLHPEAVRRIGLLFDRLSKSPALEEMPECQLQFKSLGDKQAWDAWKDKYAHLLNPK